MLWVFADINVVQLVFDPVTYLEPLLSQVFTFLVRLDLDFGGRFRFLIFKSISVEAVHTNVAAFRPLNMRFSRLLTIGAAVQAHTS